MTAIIAHEIQMLFMTWIKKHLQMFFINYCGTGGKRSGKSSVVLLQDENVFFSLEVQHFRASYRLPVGSRVNRWWKGRVISFIILSAVDVLL